MNKPNWITSLACMKNVGIATCLSQRGGISRQSWHGSVSLTGSVVVGGIWLFQISWGCGRWAVLVDSSKPAENEPSSLGLLHHRWKLVEDYHIPTMSSKGHGNDKGWTTIPCQRVWQVNCGDLWAWLPRKKEAVWQVGWLGSVQQHGILCHVSWECFGIFESFSPFRLNGHWHWHGQWWCSKFWNIRSD